MVKRYKSIKIKAHFVKCFFLAAVNFCVQGVKRLSVGEIKAGLLSERCKICLPQGKNSVITGILRASLQGELWHPFPGHGCQAGLGVRRLALLAKDCAGVG